MKWSFKIFLFYALLLFIKSKAQLDTLNYLKQFEANKANYIGQPFSKLLQDMTQIQPKTAWPFSKFNNKNITYKTIFNFCDYDYSFHNVINMSIEWADLIPFSQADYYGILHHGNFTNDEKAFYGSKIIQDIHVYR
ncbi:hypothetical protein [Chryseobacterium hagamense]|uniref:hypothetical protein n=1 Tax=Chryseobacterium hagamense TaxID=395935 RepID=UPI0011BF142C|nr:hypothetical protein [Chryseobacterium hagamense]